MALVAPAIAADLRSTRTAFPPPPAPIPVAIPAFTWTGFSAGIHGAWVSSDMLARRTRATVLPEFLPTRTHLDDSSLGGGAQIGYNLQFGSFVAGLDADVTATDIDRTRLVPRNPAPFTTSARIGTSMDHLGTVKGRVGVTLPSPFPAFRQSLLYVTGGFAYGGVDNDAQLSVSAPRFGQLLTIRGRSEDVKTGFVVGAGSEVAVTDTISIRSETLYYNLQDDNVALSRGGLRYNYRIENDGWISRLGVNIKFGTL